ncbi:GTPase [Flexivirga oryzae]|uniref:Putative GTPase n=1 Tax=Flexivirga oryzae TaxID=1794944 RepID=A0A839N6R2_9MICO|nr:GTPase [Flexivirga oryzae]MBB2890392.1 putative GTPase [Flexivirga oryzae]
MSPKKSEQGTGGWDEVTTHAEALAEALRTGAGRLPTHAEERAQQVLQKIPARQAIVGGRTVVVLAGATGSGKSSLFNALVAEPVSRIGARRPTTSVPTAAMWGDEPSGELLDWLQVGTRHQVPRGARRADALDGLVLLDLPDFDSRVAQHRAEADRVIGLADVLVWVTDPQKYADAVLHDDYVKQLASHSAVSLVVLNQIDRLGRAEISQCVEDLQRLLAADGLSDVPVLTTSAVRGYGVDDLAGTISSVVQQRNAAEQRLLADVRAAAVSLQPGVAAQEATLHADDGSELTDALCRAAGVPAVVDAVRRDHLMRAEQHGGWPFTRWVHRLRPQPLRRLGLDEAHTMNRSGAKLALGRSSLPPPGPAARAAVDLAGRRLGRHAAEGLPAAWAEAVQEAATPPDERLHDALDQAVIGTELHGRKPAWWAVSSALQWVFAAIALIGLVWLILLAILGFAHIDADSPTWIGLPIPLLMLVFGLLAGVLLALIARWTAARGARRRAAQVGSRLRAAIAVVGVEQVIDPVAHVLQAHRDTREALAAAAR